MNSKTVVLLNNKGGVSKTTTTLSLAAYLSAKRKKRILAIDLDPQANLTQSIGIEESENNIYRLLRGDVEFNPVKFSETMHVIPSHSDLNAFETEMSSEPGTH
jgi:chromosome partitioning protein